MTPPPRRPGGLVVEMTDGTLEYNAVNYRLSTFYDLAKTSVLRLAFAQAKELEPHGARPPSPSFSLSPSPHFAAISETPRFVGRAVAALAGGLAREYGFTDLDGSQPDCWRYLVEVQDAGRPADPTGYR